MSRLHAHQGSHAHPHAHQGSSTLIRLATTGVVAWSVALPLLDLARILAGWAPSPGRGEQATVAMVATAAYLPLHVRHVRHAARGSRPARAGWSLAAMAVVILGALPLAGTSWLIALPMLAVSVLIIARPPWSVHAAAALAAAPAPLAIAFGDAEWAPLYVALAMWQGASLFVLVWLLGAARRLQAARLALAEEAVARERLRIDGELRRSVGTELEAIVAAGQRADELAARDPAAAERALRTLVEGSRATLADARQMVTRYQDVSLRAVLDTAATLLRAGGVETRLVLPPGDLPDERVDAEASSALRAAVAQMLRDGSTQSCSLVVTQEGGRVHLELRSGKDSTPAEVARA